MYKDIDYFDGIDSDYLQSIHDFINEWENSNESIKVKTSGSTGEAKLVEISKSDMISSAKATGKYFGFSSNQSMILNLSPEYIAGKMMLVRGMIYKMKIIVLPLSNDPFKDIELVEKVDFGAFVPMQVENILKNDKSKKAYQNIRNVIIGGAAVNPNLELQIRSLKNNNYASFGMTETITHFALRSINSGNDFYQVLEGAAISTNENECLKLDKLFGKKVNFETTDIVDLIDERKFIWKGRSDNVINSGGVKIIPEDIENQIEYFLPTKRYYISSEKNEELGEKLVLVIEGNPMGELEENALINKLLQTMPRYHSPRKIRYVDTFEETATGKIKRTKF